MNLDMTDHCMTDFCIWWTICLVPVRCISRIRHMYTTDFAYDAPISLIPLSLSYPSSPVFTWKLLLSTIRWVHVPGAASSQRVKPLTSLMLPLANLANTKWCKRPKKWYKPWHMGTHLKVLSERYPMSTNMTGFRWFSKCFASLCFGRK